MSSNGASATAVAAPPTEEDLMRTRLTIDGDGMGDDRRLTLLLKNVIKFCNAAAPADGGGDAAAAAVEDLGRSRDRISAQLEQASWMDGKSKLAQRMNALETQNYESLYSEIEQGISRAHEDIAEAKRELVQARKVRRNRMEYDALAKVICQNPDREATGRKLEEVREELEQLKGVEEALDEKLEMRKKSFHVLVHSIHQLQAMLAKEEEEDGGGGAASSSSAATEQEGDDKDNSADMDTS